MKVICAWCNRHLHGRDDAERISHGVCGVCMAFQLWLVDDLQAPEQVWEYWLEIGGEG